MSSQKNAVVPISDVVADPGRHARIQVRAAELLVAAQDKVRVRVDRMFVPLLAGQWVFGVLLAVFLSPRAWEGKSSSIHLHVPIAVCMGAALSGFPILLAVLRPGTALTRHVVAVSQMLWSTLLIHLTGGRIETHFHIFGSLAFLAFYLDWKVVLTGTTVVVLDHTLRGAFWPESIYGVPNPEWWRFMEHAFWVVFEDAVLLTATFNGLKDLQEMTLRQAEVAVISEAEADKTAALEMAIAELRGN